MAYYVNRNVKLTWWERTYIPEIIRGMIITSRHFFKNLFGFVPFFLGKKKDREIFTVYYPEETMQFPIAYRGRPVLASGTNTTGPTVSPADCAKSPARLIASTLFPVKTAASKTRLNGIRSSSPSITRFASFAGFAKKPALKKRSL